MEGEVTDAVGTENETDDEMRNLVGGQELAKECACVRELPICRL